MIRKTEFLLLAKNQFLWGVFGVEFIGIIFILSQNSPNQCQIRLPCGQFTMELDTELMSYHFIIRIWREKNIKFGQWTCLDLSLKWSIDSNHQLLCGNRLASTWKKANFESSNGCYYERNVVVLIHRVFHYVCLFWQKVVCNQISHEMPAITRWNSHLWKTKQPLMAIAHFLSWQLNNITQQYVLG